MEILVAVVGAVGALLIAVATYFLGVRTERLKWAREDIVAARSTKAPLYEAFRKSADEFVELATRCRHERRGSAELSAKGSELRAARRALEVLAPDAVRVAGIDVMEVALEVWASAIEESDREARIRLEEQRELMMSQQVRPDPAAQVRLHEAEWQELLRAFADARNRFARLTAEDLARSQ